MLAFSRRSIKHFKYVATASRHDGHLLLSFTGYLLFLDAKQAIGPKDVSFDYTRLDAR